MSVGHVARAVEEAGIPTVVVQVQAFAHVARRMVLPRVVLTRHPMGRPMGAPGDVGRQRQVLDTALELAASATTAGTVLELEGSYEPGSMSG